MPGEPLEQWSRRIRDGLAALPGEIDDTVTEWAHELRARVRREIPRASGDLARSLRVDVDARDARAEVELSSTDPAAAALERGGTSTGRPWMAVPLRPDVARLGTPRADAGLVVVRMRDGRLFLGSPNGSGIDMRWKLERTISRRARPVIGPAWQRALRDLPRRILDTIDDAVGVR